MKYDEYIAMLKKKSGTKMYLGVFVVVCCLGGLLLWKMHSKPVQVVETIPTVRTVVIADDKDANAYLYAGEVRGRYESQLAFQVSGKIIKRNVQLGSVVKAGDLLMQVDAKDMNQMVSGSLAQVQSSESQLKLAQSNLQRYRMLFERNAISRAELDQYENSYEVAKAGLHQSSAQYQQSANQLDYTSLRADADGVITAINAEAGQVVAQGQTVVTIVREGDLEVEVAVPENRIAEIRQNPEVTVSFWALPGLKVSGVVREVSPIAAPVTRTYQVRVKLVNPPPTVTLGMTASVAANVEGKESAGLVAVPMSAIYQAKGAPSVWVVMDSTVRLWPVQITSVDNNKAKVTGLKAGMVVVSTGVHKLLEGQKVQIADGENR